MITQQKVRHDRCFNCKAPFQSRLDMLQKHCHECRCVSKTDLLCHTIDCRECGVTNSDRENNCDVCGAVLLKKLVYQGGYIRCHKCGEHQLKPNFLNTKTCATCNEKLWTNTDDRNMTFFVGQSVYFVSNAGFVKPGIVVGIEARGTSVRVRHAEREWSDVAYNEVHTICEVAPTLKNCCDLIGKRSRRRPALIADTYSSTVKRSTKRQRAQSKRPVYHWLTYQLSPDDLRLSSIEAKYAKKIGSQFRDKEEENLPVFEIVDVVKRFQDSVLMFAYKPFDILDDDEKGETPEPKDEDYEYTPCKELLAADWAEWM